MILLLNAAFMYIAAIISYFNGPDSGFGPLLLSALLTTFLGIFPLFFVERTDKISSKESYGIVIGAWLISCMVGAFPYLIWGGEFSIINAWFESVSGFTTTGASILQDIEVLPKGLLFWRSSTNWIGGIGVVMFALLIIPMMGRSKMSVSNVELSSLAKDNFHYRTQKIVRILLVVYVGLTIVQTILLNIAGMNLFDAINHSFATIATGGFSTKNASIGAYDSIWIELITIVFMLVSSLHIGVTYATLTGRPNNIFRSEVARFHLFVALTACIIISFSLWDSNIYSSFWEALRYGTFQAVSLVTSTGFSTANSAVWTSLAIIILIYLSIQGGCAGSTSGGLKSDRMLLAGKVIKAKIKQQQHPNAVIRIKHNGIIQENSIIHFAMLYIVIYVLIILVGTVVNAFCGLDTMTSFSAAVTSMGNIGPGFGDVGSMSNFSSLPILAKFNCSVLMLLGRLEIFGLIQLFLLKWWV